MRYEEFGKFDAEWAAFSLYYVTGTSMIVDGSAANLDNLSFRGVVDTQASKTVVSWTGTSAPTECMQLFWQLAMAQLRARLGHAPIVLSALLKIWRATLADTFDAVNFDLHRVLSALDIEDLSYRYRDYSALTTWYLDAWAPVPGKDIIESPFSAALLSGPYTEPTPGDYSVLYDVTQELTAALLSGVDWAFLQKVRKAPATGSYHRATFYFDTQGKRPHLAVRYMLPLEFYAADVASGLIRLDKPLDASKGLDLYRLYLGAVERAQTGTPVKLFLRNHGEVTHPILQVWDDSPTWSDPVQIAGAGSGVLSHVVLAESAVSQQYTAKFTSASAFQVKGVAYRDNPTSLNPTYGTGGWDGTIGSDFVAPSGGLTIPAAGWSLAGFQVNDEFEFSVLGNTTDAAWPADSNDQVEMTFDSGGSADGANFRPIPGQTTRSTASVTIDATSKKFPTKAVVALSWPASTKAFVSDADGSPIQHGAVASVATAALGTAAFTGSGLNDLTRSGNYRGNADRNYRVELDATGTPDTFKWSHDGGSSWEATGVAITGALQHLEDGVYVTFAATTGHTLGDRWDWTATCWGVTLSGLTNNSDVMPAGSIVATTLPLLSVAPGVWRQASADFGASSSPANRVYLTVAPGSDFTAGQTVFVQDLANEAVYEERVIQTVAATYLDMTAAFAGDYEAGAIVLRKGSGEKALWLRPHTTSGTTEQRKDFRLNVRS